MNHENVESSVEATGPQAVPPVEPELQPGKVGLVVVLSAKGGCGATLIATNLAAHLAESQRVCLVDLDLCKGDVAAFLDLHSHHSLNVLFDNQFDMDTAMLEGSVDEHASGLHVLTQPYDLTELHQVSADEVRMVLPFIRKNYDVVVVDAGSRVDVATLTAAMIADEVLLVTTTDVVALRDAQRVLGLLRRLDVPAGRVRLVLNKHTPGAGVSESDIVAQLHAPIAATITADHATCQRADAKGKLLHQVAPRAKVSADVRSLWPQLRGQLAVTTVTTTRFSWLWSRWGGGGARAYGV